MADAKHRALGLGEYPCAHRGCDVPVKRYGGLWWHVRKAGAHRPRPEPILSAIEPEADRG